MQQIVNWTYAIVTAIWPILSPCKAVFMFLAWQRMQQKKIRTLFFFIFSIPASWKNFTTQYWTTYAENKCCDYLRDIFRIYLGYRRSSSLFSRGFFLHGGHNKMTTVRKRRKSAEIVCFKVSTDTSICFQREPL